MKTIACLNMKGGCGKSTIAVSLAGALGKTVILDLDPQQSAVTWKPEGITVTPLRVRQPGELLAALRALESEGHDYAIIDLPPEMEILSKRAAVVADLALIPVTPSPLDLWASTRAVDAAKDARGANGKPAILLVPSRTLSSTLLARELPTALASFKEEVGPGIGQRVALAEAAISHKWIGDFAPDSPATSEFLMLARHVKNMCQRARATVSA